MAFLEETKDRAVLLSFRMVRDDIYWRTLKYFQVAIDEQRYPLASKLPEPRATSDDKRLVAGMATWDTWAALSDLQHKFEESLHYAGEAISDDERRRLASWFVKFDETRRMFADEFNQLTGDPSSPTEAHWYTSKAESLAARDE